MLMTRVDISFQNNVCVSDFQMQIFSDANTLISICWEVCRAFRAWKENATGHKDRHGKNPHDDQDSTAHMIQFCILANKTHRSD